MPYPSYYSCYFSSRSLLFLPDFPTSITQRTRTKKQNIKSDENNNQRIDIWKRFCTWKKLVVAEVFFRSSCGIAYRCQHTKERTHETATEQQYANPQTRFRRTSKRKHRARRTSSSASASSSSQEDYNLHSLSVFVEAKGHGYSQQQMQRRKLGDGARTQTYTLEQTPVHCSLRWRTRNSLIVILNG
jgi:hypothetical protein